MNAKGDGRLTRLVCQRGGWRVVSLDEDADGSYEHRTVFNAAGQVDHVEVDRDGRGFVREEHAAAR